MISITLNKSMPYSLLEEIAHQCSVLDSEVHILKADHIVNARNLIGLITLSLHPEDRILVFIEGADASDAERILKKLLN